MNEVGGYEGYGLSDYTFAMAQSSITEQYKAREQIASKMMELFDPLHFKFTWVEMTHDFGLYGLQVEDKRKRSFMVLISKSTGKIVGIYGGKTE